MCIKYESGSSCFQPGESPSRGLLRDYEHLDGPSFQALGEGSRKKFRSYIDIENDFQHLKSEITHMKSSMNSVSFLRKKKSFSNCKASKQIGSIHIERPKASVKKLLSFKYLILTTFDKNITSVENFWKS